MQRLYGYSFIILTSLTLSAVISIYKLDSLILSFGVTALVFGINAIYSHCSKKDHSKEFLGYGLTIALGIIALAFLNIFIGSSAINTILSIACFFLVVILEYFNAKQIDVKLNEINTHSLDDKVRNPDEVKKCVSENFCIFASLCIFSNFISLVVKLIVLFGEKKDNKQFQGNFSNNIPNILISGFSIEDAFKHAEEDVAITASVWLY